MSILTDREIKAIRQAFGDRVRQARKRTGISQEALADLCGLHRTYIGSVERGERNVSLVNIHAIAKALNLSAQSLFESESKT